MIALGCDHAGYPLKEAIKQYLDSIGEQYTDFGTYSEESVDYPIFAAKTAHAVADGVCEKGILCCGTGIGISIAANKINGIRAALCTDVFSAKMSREHNDANVICMGGRVTGPGPAVEIIRAYLSSTFAGGRHARRVGKIMDLENK